MVRDTLADFLLKVPPGGIPACAGIFRSSGHTVAKPGKDKYPFTSLCMVRCGRQGLNCTLKDPSVTTTCQEQTPLVAKAVAGSLTWDQKDTEAGFRCTQDDREVRVSRSIGRALGLPAGLRKTAPGFHRWLRPEQQNSLATA